MTGNDGEAGARKSASRFLCGAVTLPPLRLIGLNRFCYVSDWLASCTADCTASDLTRFLTRRMMYNTFWTFK